MEETNDVQALEKISNEVDESQIKVILSTQCIKAQAFLLDKLKKQTERHKETCNFISSTNLKIETEIKQADQEIKSKLIAQETLKSANVELRKEWLLAKSRKSDILDRVAEGKNKYEALWLECKTRYESIPFVQKLLQATERQRATDQNIVEMDKQITNLYDEMEKKRRICAKLDKDRCVELANFMVYDMPKAINIINKKTEMIDKLTKEIEELLKKQDPYVTDVMEASNAKKVENVKDCEQSQVVTDISKTDDEPLIPKLNLFNFDLDMMDVNLDQVKMKKNEILNAIPTKTNTMSHNFEKVVEQRLENFNYISPYFKPYNEEKPRNFSVRKLINILDDVNINEGQVYDIVQKLNPEQLREVDEIPAERITTANVTETISKDKEDKPAESETIAEINLTAPEENIVIPPTQFLDIALSVQLVYLLLKGIHNDDVTRKRVSFDLPSSVQINEIKDDDNAVNESTNLTTNSQLDVSAVSEQSFMKMKEMLLKKHNLDLSPQFVYAKNNVLQKRDDERPVISKFFSSHNQEDTIDEMEVDDEAKAKHSDEIIKSQKDGHETESQKVDNGNNMMAMDLDEALVSTPKPKVHLEASEEKKSGKPITGLLFTHGAQAIPDSLNVSMSTTGYEDSDFPHCIDSSLLLSPKADIPVHNGDNPEVLSQEVPNFLSGFRKTTFSFFDGASTSAEHKQDSSAENQGNNNFNFNFGGEKKNRGGLFSLFR